MNAVSFSWLLIVVIDIIYFVDANWITGNLCWSMPCMNGGSCFGSAYNYICICPIHYTGALCEKRLGACQDNPCGNRGLCMEKSLTSFECRCYVDYMGPTCEEHVKKNNSNIWSSLSPVHTRILFDMLQEAYNSKAKKKSIIGSENGQIDFLDILPTLTTSLPTIETTFTTEQNETELIIPAHDIQIDKIFPDISTVSILDINTYESTEQSSQFDSTTIPESDINDTTMILENITTKVVEQIQSDDHASSTQESTTMITSTSTQSSNDNHTESVTITTTESIDFISSNDSYSSMNISKKLSSLHPTSLSKPSRSHFLYKLCKKIISHILPNSPSFDSSSISSNSSSKVLLSWLRKYLKSSKTTTTTSTISSFIINETPTLSIPLKRIHMDDALHQMNNNIDNEH